MTDRIEKELIIRAPRSRVWRALTDPAEFGTWFGARFESGTFAPGQSVKGMITIKGYEHVPLDLQVVDVQPEERMSYRWHPYGVDPNVDYSKEERTLVTFTLAEVEEGTRLTAVESGFDRIPQLRRAEAFRMNDAGWAGQIKNIDRYVTTTR